ncbi:MAG: trypsin-like serine protease [Bdellovibrionaceae bacterium]|nr:trypsin-like serine protease [Pseudobdellovibrionaceae bacterium]
MNIFWGAFSVLVSLQVLATSGPQLSGKEYPQHLFCQLETQSSLNTQVCTATIIGKNRILTAAHCFQKTRSYKLKSLVCNNKSFFLKNLHIPVEFNYSLVKRDEQQRQYDYAVIETNEIINEEIPLLENNNKFQNALSSDQCAFVGSDLINNKIKAVWLNSFDYNVSPALAIQSHIYSMVEGGDSGGAFICKNKLNQWNLLAVISGKSSFEYINYLAPVTKEKIHALISKNNSIKNKVASGTNLNPWNDSIDNLVKIKVGSTYYIKPFSKVYHNGDLLIITDQNHSKFKVTKVIDRSHVQGQLVVSSPPLRYMCIENIICNEDLQKVTVNTKNLNLL